jgi:hypothetical protein
MTCTKSHQQESTIGFVKSYCLETEVAAQRILGHRLKSKRYL